MALADMNWTEVSFHKMVAEFLRAEHESFSFFPPWVPLIENPNLNDPLENHRRLRMLYIKRGNFMCEIPPDTKWYEVQSLTGNELDELYVSARHNSKWNEAGNKLDRVAKAAPEPLKSPPDEWARIILWGHDKTGPFSIIEGCHRMIGYAGANPRPPLKIGVLVGLSPSYCFWHGPDPAGQLGQGLYVKSLGPLFDQHKWLYIRPSV
jgi:hypothetical protein